MPFVPAPELFIDRSLGRHLVPEALRGAGATVHTMAEVYGERIGQGLPDEEWLGEAAKHDWVVLMKDDKIRYRPVELAVIAAHGLRAFCVTNANLRGHEMASRIVASLPDILSICAQPGPYIYGIYADGLRRLWPPPT